jgi:NADPH-dependent glutamate synthase beta subunit-like oxidoreductase
VEKHFNDNSTQKEQQLLTDALCFVCEDAPQLKSIQLHKILPTPLTKILRGPAYAA